MLHDRFRKKIKRFPSGDDLSLEEIDDISAQVPQIDDVLAKVDSALDSAERLEKELRQELTSRDYCTC